MALVCKHVSSVKRQMGQLGCMRIFSYKVYYRLLFKPFVLLRGKATHFLVCMFLLQDRSKFYVLHSDLIFMFVFQDLVLKLGQMV